MDSPPETDIDPVTETLSGEQITDPYRWLEGDDEAVDGWERRQNDYTDGVVGTERRESLQPAFETVGHREKQYQATVRGGRYFQRIEAPDAEQPALVVRDGVDDDPRTLLDPADLGETTAFQWFVPSLDGDRILYGIMDAGTEQYDLRIRDVETGEILDRIDDIGRCNPQTVAWTGEGFYYMATGTGDTDQLDKELRYHDLDGEDRLVTDEFQPERWPSVQVDRESGLVIVSISELGADSELYVLANGHLEPVLTGIAAAFEPLASDGYVYLRTNYDAPRGTVLGVDAESFVDADGPAEFETLVPEGEDVLAGIETAGDGFALHRLRDATSTVSLHRSDGTLRHELSLPEFCGVPWDGLAGSDDSPELLVHIAGFDRPQTVVHVDTDREAGPDDWRIPWQPSLPAAFDPRDELELTIDRLWVDSTGGASVPVFVIHRADLEPDGEAPTVLYGYGGFRIPLVPSFDAYRLPFLADGGVFAQACLRGGLEFGERWHEDGSRACKERTFEDFEAAADALVERGYTSPDRLAAWGGSNGGLTVGAALTRSPDRFGAAVCNVPLLDMLRFHEFLLGQAWTAEYGSPEDPEAVEWLRSYSPYHNVEERAYPATLFTTAAGDTRVHPGHARKMTARLQAATTGDDPICFRSVEETGHGLGTPTSVETELELDKWTFVYEALDIER